MRWSSGRGRADASGRGLKGFVRVRWNGPDISPASDPAAASHTISLFSLSKSFGFASWRIGWMIFPARLESAMRKTQDTLLICPPVVSQYAAIGALHAGSAYVREKLRAIAEVRGVVRRQLETLVADQICVLPPAQGAFYFLLRYNSPRPALDVE